MDDWELKAFNFAKENHKGQIDKESGDYFTTHILRVVQILKATLEPLYAKGLFTREEYRNLIIAAYLHDLVEDTDIELTDIAHHFNINVSYLVKEVTKTGYNKFPNLKTIEGYILKYVDRLANLSRRKGGMNNEELKAYMIKSIFWKT